MIPRRHVVAALLAVFTFQTGAVVQPPRASASARQPSSAQAAQLDSVSVVVPYGSAQWKYQQVGPNPDPGVAFGSKTFVDSGWPDGTAGFGSGGGCPLAPVTPWAVGTDMLVRRHITTIPPGTTGVQVWIAIDNDIKQVFWNGDPTNPIPLNNGTIVHEGCATLDSFGFSIPPQNVVSDNVLAVRGSDRGVESFMDIQVVTEGYGAESAQPSSTQYQNGETGADPVQSFHGAFVYNRTDVAIAGRGPTPVLTRSYNSGDLRVGPMGPGWTHSYNARIRSPGDGTLDLLFVHPDGNTDRFTRNNDETFSPGPAVYSTLIRNADLSYTVTQKDQSRLDFDSAGRLTKVTDRYGNASNLTYNGNGQLATVSDPAGRGSLTFTYTNGLLTGVADWATPARTVTYEYDGSGRLWKVTDREAKTTTFGYDGTSSRIASITDALNHVALTLTYDASGRVATQKDARGLTSGDVTTFGYVVNGDGSRVTTHTYPVTSFEPAFHPTVVDTYSANGWIQQRVSHPSSTETLTETYTYDGIGDRASVTDPRGNRTDFCYDVSYAGGVVAGSRGNLTRVIAPAPVAGANRPVTLVNYDATNNVTQTVAPKGVPSGQTVTCATNLAAITTAYATDLGYDASQTKLLSVTGRFTDPDSGLKTAITKYEYADAANPGLVTKAIPPRGNTGGTPDYTYATTMTYVASGSKAGLLASVADALGDTTTYDYDAVGRVIAVVDPMGNAAGGVPADHTTNVVYDKEDRTRFVKLPAPAAGGAQLVTETRYDAVGNPIVRLDPAGQVTTYAYDERDGLFQVKESPNAWTDPAAPPAGVITTEYAYDATGNLSRITRAKGDGANERVTESVFDGRRLARRETQYPSWPTTTPTLVATSAYDANGNPATAVDPLGQTTTAGYDALNRLTSIDYSSPATPDVGYGYDANGNRTSMTDGTGSTSYAYDEANRLTSTTTPGSKTVGYRYDLDGNRTKLIYPDATAVTYTFNKASQLASLLDWASRSTSYTYFADGAVKDATNVNATVATYAYDNARRLTSIVHTLGATTIDQRAYTLDPLGNVLAVTGGSAGDTTTRVSESTSHGQGNGLSDDSYMSQDARYVTYRSTASTLVTGDTNGVMDAFVHDRLTATTTRVSTTAAGAEGNAQSDDPAFSANGRYVTFRSQASNFVANDTNGSAWDIFVKDLQTGVIERVSVSSAGAQANNRSADPAISADGRYVVFSSLATNLISGDTNGQEDVFLRDRTAGTTIRISVSSAGVAGNGLSDDPILSDDGRYLVYQSTATNLVTGDTNAVRDIFLYDRVTATTSRVSLDSAGVQANAASNDPAISPDGSRVAFESDATNLVTGDTNAKQDVFLRVIATGVTSRVSVTNAGAQGTGRSSDPSLSIDGTIVAFTSSSASLVTGDTNGKDDIFVRNTVAGTTVRFSLSSTGAQSDNLSDNPSIAGDGKTVAFHSDATNLISGDTNNLADVFVRGPGIDASTYGYDRLSRLTTVTGPDGPRTYAYDPAGNRSSRILSGTTTVYTYDRADRISAAGAMAITVNANGNTTAKGPDAFTFDQPNRLKTATVAGTTETYVYDGDGVRFSRQVGAGSPIRYVSDVNRSLPVTIDDGTRKYVYGLGLAYAVAGSTIEVYHPDRLGSTRAITDAAGAVTATYRTDEWGVPTTTTGSSSQPYRFTGEPQDGTGLIYLRARYLDPSIGRFMSRDRMVGSPFAAQSLNRCVYATNNPVGLTDPSGLKPVLESTPSYCDLLRRDIDATIDELAARYLDLVMDPRGLQFDHWSESNPHPAYGSVEGHQRQFTEKQRNLEKLNNRYGRDCPDDPPPPAAPGRLLGNAPSPDPQLFHPGQVDPQYEPAFWGLTGLGLAIYLIVSEGSRVIPIRNLLPVP
jgi:RHS repeat-associated protein